MSELGTLLVRAREARGLTLEDAERDTRISRRYLQALETEQFEAIPAPVYARGFLRSYSQYLGLDPQEMLALFPRDDDHAQAQPVAQVTLQAAQAEPLQATVELGRTESIWISCDLTASALPALSKARYLTVVVEETVKAVV